MNPTWQSGDISLYLGDCLEVLPTLAPGSVDAVVTDPPYPNGAGHFTDGIAAAIRIMQDFACDRWLVFWHELERPPVPLPLVALHIWHRNNTNRPDNYEAIYQFNADGHKRASRVLPFPVIYPGLTGCIEATGHPTQKNEKLMRRLIELGTKPGETAIDWFMGSGTTGVACVQTGRRFIGIEIDAGYFEIAKRRIEQAQQQMRLPL